MEILIITLLAAILIICLVIAYKLNKPAADDNSIAELKEYIVKLESAISAKIDNSPELVQSKIAETLSTKFADLNQNIAYNNHQTVKEFGEFKNDISVAIGQNSKALSEEFAAFKAGLASSLGDNSKRITDDLNAFKDLFIKSLADDFDRLTRSVEEKLDNIDRKVQNNLSRGFEKTNETFVNVLERLAKIDEAQKKIDSLSTNIVSLQDILTDKKSRGTFGETHLKQILTSVFGEKNDKIYRIQHKMPNNNIVDAMIFTPEPLGAISVDSKFPLENYKRMTDRNLTDEDRARASKIFETDVKKHINDIADKYIITGVTSDSAIMFLPAEAIFAELHAYHDSLITYAHKRKVWITSPTTFMAILTTLQVVLNNLERRKHAGVIQAEIEKLAAEFGRYSQRWDKLKTHISTVQKDVDEIHTTTNKITKRFGKISDVDLGEKESGVLGVGE